MSRVRTRKPGDRRTWSFTLVLAPTVEVTEALENALFEAGADDALLGVTAGVPFLDFDREAESLADAVESAMRTVAGSGTGAEVVRVEPDDPVSAAGIARRTGRSRESIRLLIRGERGPGGFPAPVSGLTSSSPSFSWAEVAEWFARHRVDAGIGPREVEAARFVRELNSDLRQKSARRSARAARAES